MWSVNRFTVFVVSQTVYKYINLNGVQILYVLRLMVQV